MEENPLKFLSPDDLQLICAHATRMQFKPGDEIIREGSRKQTIFVLRSGTVRVDFVQGGRSIEMAQLGPGDMFGEMAFIEDSGASATVFAADNVEVDAIPGVQLCSLLNAVPGLAVRFYRSLAFTLSKRLRHLSLQVVALVREQLPDTKTLVLPRQFDDDLSL